MDNHSLTPLSAMGAIFAAWVPDGSLPVSFILLEDNKRWQDASERGKIWLGANNEDALKSILPDILDGQQSVCAFANLVLILLSENNRDHGRLLDDVAQLLNIQDSDARDVRRSIEVLCARDSITNDKQWEICCAALLALSAADDDESAAESCYLEWLAPSAVIIEAGKKQLRELRADGVVEKVYRLSSRQKRFLAANLLAMMFADGKWRGAEQEMLEEFTEKLFIGRSELEKLFKAAYAIFNLSVFE